MERNSTIDEHQLHIEQDDVFFKRDYVMLHVNNSTVHFGLYARYNCIREDTFLVLDVWALTPINNIHSVN